MGTNGNAIQVEGLRKRFGEVVALDGIDVEVAEGTIFGLLGPNGAGKTTLVRVLATILQRLIAKPNRLAYTLANARLPRSQNDGVGARTAADCGSPRQATRVAISVEPTTLPTELYVVCRACSTIARLACTAHQPFTPPCPCTPMGLQMIAPRPVNGLHTLVVPFTQLR